jgi:hypothetical protein
MRCKDIKIYYARQATVKRRCKNLKKTEPESENDAKMPGN